ncbi:MAG: AsmA family protein [Alphaproteobacteria bacterium]|nr:AsmA family protein [Alphaproteobacteria bacterium]
MKTFLKIFSGIVFVLILALSGAYMGRNKLIKTAVEKIGPKFTQTTVLLGEIDFQPLQGHFMIKEFHIGNPEGFSEKKLFSLGSLTVDWQPKSLLSDKIIIEKVAVEKVSASHEVAKNGTNNIEVLQKNILGEPKPAEKKAPEPAAKDKKQAKPAKAVDIKEVTVKDVKVDAEATILLGEANFQPVQGHGVIKELHVGNPKGFSDKKLFSLSSVTVDLQPETLLSNKIIINKIMVDNVFANYEIAKGTNNIDALQKKLLGEPKPAAKKAAKPAAKDKKPAKNVVIKDLTVKDAKVAASISGIGVSLPLPTIHLTGIGEKKPSTFKQALASIVKVFSTETLGAIGKATTEALKSGADSLGKFFKELF